MSGLKSKILLAVKKAEQSVDDLKITVKHVKRGAAVYVPGSAPTYPETLTDVSVVMTRFEAKEVDNDRVQGSDWKGLVFCTDALPDFNINDLLRFPSGLRDFSAGDYRILYDDKVVVGDRVVLHQLQLRKS